MNKIDKKILELIDLLKSEGVIKFDTDFAKAAGISKQHLQEIKKGKAHFTTEHVDNFCNNLGINANWIFGLSDEVYLPIEKI